MPVTINGTTGIAGVDGSASTPSYQGTDTNTGIFYPAADTIAFAEGGTEVMRIDSNGNVGIGTTSPSGYGLEVKKASGTAGMLVASGSNTGSFAISGTDLYVANSTAGTTQFWTNGSERMRIDSSGRVTTPFQPCVFAVKNNGTGWTSYGGTFIFNNAPLNVGNHYNASTGVFTCPVAGVYEVYAMILGGNSGGNGTVSVRRNGVDYNFPGGHYNSNGTSLWFAVPQFTYINCAANDQLTIYVTASAGSLFDTNSYPQMSIRLVQ